LGGQIAKTFKFTFGGIVDLILSPEKQVTEYSMVSIGQAIPSAAAHGGYLAGNGWNWFLTLQFFFLAMVVPLIRVILLMILWSVPMTLVTTKRLHHLAEVVAAWSAMDVFLVSIIAAVMEIGQLSAEVISSAFGPIEGTLCEVLEAIPLPVLNAIFHQIGLNPLDLSKGCQLFRVDAVLHSGCWILLAAVLICEVIAHIIMELCEASISERMAMLSAYHRAKNPLISPRRRAAITRTTSDAYLARASMDIVAQNKHLRRLLSAQEIGSKNFVGSWFDFLYGPFPRGLWGALVDCRLMKRVDWEDIGQDLRADLVEQSGGEEEQDERTPLRPNIDRSGSENLLEELLHSEDAEQSWVANSPSIHQ
jgi:hypothetical protein